MKITRKEWRVLKTALGGFADNPAPRKTKRTQTPDQAVADNLLVRFKQELTFEKGVKP